VEVLVAFIRGMVYYESGFNPRSASVDVGTKENRDTHSVGLMQMSVVDQKNYGFNFGFNYDDLMDPIKNLTLAMAIMKRQVEKKGRLILRKGTDTGVYWAVIYKGGKYDKSAAIIAGVKALKFSSTVPQGDTVPNWYTIAETELGQSESKNPTRIAGYHAATSLPKASQKASVAWCASFVCWVLKQAGKAHTGSAWARDYIGYGTPLAKPKKHCILVFERNAPGGDSHVGFWTGEETSTQYLVLGGNQDNMVKKKYYAKKDLLAARWPT